jgi:hypothetical protein
LKQGKPDAAQLEKLKQFAAAKKAFIARFQGQEAEYAKNLSK